MGLKFTIFIALIFCSIGRIYQLYNINKIYFTKETTTNVMFENENEVSLPAITLCFDKYHLFNEIHSKNSTANQTIEDYEELSFNSLRMTIVEQRKRLKFMIISL